MWGAITAGIGLISGLNSSSAARSAGDTQAAATDRATQAQERMFDKQVELQKPFRDAGISSNNRLMYLLGLSDLNGAAPDATYGSLLKRFGMSDFQTDPGYAFRQSEGMKGIENSAAARGSLLSGAALKAIQKYGQDLASQEYGNAYSRYNSDQTNAYNKLAGIVNTGQGATNQLTNAAGNLGNSIANNITSGAAAQAAGQVGSANAWSNALGNATNAWQQNQLMNMIRSPGVSYTPGYGYGTSWGE